MAKDLFGDPLHTAADIEGAEYCGHFVRATDAAILFDDGERQSWLPKSKIAFAALDHCGDPHPGDAVAVTIPDWLAREKGLMPS